MGVFHFRQFDVDDSGCGMKTSSDSVLLGAWFLSPDIACRHVADIGTGAGILSLMAAQIYPQALICGVEIDSDAARTAASNFAVSPWNDRLEVYHGDFSDYSPDAAPDIIISNPPYFAGGLMSPDRPRAIARHQKELNFSSLIHYAADKLAAGGHLGFISPAEFENDIIFEAELAGLKLRRLCRVNTSAKRAPSRILLDFCRCDGNTEISHLQLRGDDGKLTAGYIALVKPFYITIH